MQLQREDFLMYGGAAFFVAFILYDIKTAYDRGALWLPSRYLVLYGLILQLAAEVEVKNVSFSGAHQQEQLEKLMSKQLSIDCARLTLCVFVGYLLPGTATKAYRGVWTTIAALLVSLITHISMEFYIAIQFYKTGNVKQVRNQMGVWLLVSGGILLLLLFHFFMSLAYAIFFGKSCRYNLSRRIAAILHQNSNNEELEWENFKEKMLKSWIVTRVCQPEYILTRTAFSTGVALLVTISVAVFGAKVVRLRSLLNQRFGLFVFQSIFILVGWIVILYRWLAPLYYIVLFTPSLTTPKSELKAVWEVLSTPLDHLKFSLSSTIVVYTGLKFILAVLLSPLLVGLWIIFCIIFIIAIMSIRFVLSCWLMSWRMFGNKVIRKLFSVDTKLGKMSSGDFDRYKEALESLRIPAENAASLWIANERFFNCLKLRMDRAYEEGRSCKELIEVIGSCVGENNVGFFADQLVEPLPSVKMYFPGLKEPLWSLTVLSLLNMIIQITLLDMDHSAVDNAVKAYKQAYRLMDLVGCPENIDITLNIFGSTNVEAFQVSLASRRGMEEVIENYEQRKGKRRATGVTLEACLGIIQEKLEAAEHYLQRYQMLGEIPNAGAQDAKWYLMAPRYTDYKVCHLILANSDTYSSVEDLRKKLLAFLKDVISSCVLRLPDLLLKSSRHWAAEFAEEKICKAAEMVGIAEGVIVSVKKSDFDLNNIF